MSYLDARQASGIYRGTVEEVFSHRDEIPVGAIVELKVLPEASETEAKNAVFGERSLADILREIGTVKGLPSDMAAQSEKYMRRFGETANRRTLEP